MDTIENNKRPTYAAVIVHGICANNGSQQVDFSKPLSELVYPVKSQAERDEYWKEAVWEKVTNAADDKIQDVVLQVMNLYDKTKYWRDEKLASAKHRWQKLCIYVIYGVRQVIHFFIGRKVSDLLDLTLDLPLYLGNPRGEKIREVVVGRIKEAMAKTGGVVLIGHSLGSVIAYDVAKRNMDTGNPLNIKTLITMGSPLKWVTDIRRAEDGEVGPINSVAMSLPGVRWINIYDKEDPIALKDELPDTMFRDVENVQIASGKKFIAAHTCYWTDNNVASIVRNAMFAGSAE